MDDRDFFDKLAPSWDKNETLSIPSKINHILDYFDLRPGQSVLDLGTGTGVLLPFVAQRIGPTGNITAVDYSSGMIKKAIEKFSGIVPAPLFLNIDFEKDNINGEFDRIILYCVYPHLHSPYETLKWLEKVNLKNKGEIFIAFPSDEVFINNIHKERHSEGDLLPNAEDLSRVLSDQGLKSRVVSYSPQEYIVAISKNSNFT